MAITSKITTTHSNELAAMGEIVGWRERSGWDLPDSFRQYAAHVPRVAAQAGPFSYRSTDTEVLGWVLEAAAGVPLSSCWRSGCWVVSA